MKYLLMLLIGTILVTTVISGAEEKNKITSEKDIASEKITNWLGMEFIRIEPDIFTMGEGSVPRIRDNGDLDYDEQPAHKVMITNAFYILKMAVNQAIFSQSGLTGNASDISWEQADAFCKWLSENDSLYNYNLPTEAQWEYVYEHQGEVQSMGSDWEWTRDWHAPYWPDGAVDPLGPANGKLKVLRYNGLDRKSLPLNATYTPWNLGETRPAKFRVVIEIEESANPDIRPALFTESAIKQRTDIAEIGPNSTKPYFTVRFAVPIPPDNSREGDAAILGLDPGVADHNHSPGFEILPNGDVLAIWFSGIDRDEYGKKVRMSVSRLRYGSDQWDMIETFWDIKDMNDESGLLWTEWNQNNWDNKNITRLFSGGRISNSERRPFVMATTENNGAVWKLSRPKFPVAASNFTAQPAENAFRRTSDGTIFIVADGDGNESMLWKSSDNGKTWYAQGGRTGTRHSTVLPNIDETKLISFAGKNSHIGNNYNPRYESNDWGESWSNGMATPFSHLNGNQRPSATRLKNGKIVLVIDAQHRNGSRPPESEINYARGAIVAISDDDGESWHIKNLPVVLTHESDHDDGTIGYATVRQGPNGIIHILTTMTHPCLHYEFNEAWLLSNEGDITPESTGGTVKYYSEYYPNGQLKQEWSARITPGGRYLLHGKDISYYPSGVKAYEAEYENGRKISNETYWNEQGIMLWRWKHKETTSTFTNYWSNGLKRVVSTWNTKPEVRSPDNRHLNPPDRKFSGFVAEGPNYHWSRDGRATYALNFNYGELSNPISYPAAQSKTADLNDDDVINENDREYFDSQMGWKGLPGGYNPADFDFDGDVDEEDRMAYQLSSMGDNEFERNKIFNLCQNYPNPFNPSTSIKFSLPKTIKVKLEVYDILGRKVIILVNEERSPGSYSIQWNGQNEADKGVSSGIYFYKLTAGEFIKTKKMIFLR